MADVSVAILGLGRIGASVALALKRHSQGGGQHKFNVIGYDSSADNVKNAQNLKAVDKVENRPENAVKGCDIVVVALAFGEVQMAYQIMARSLRAGAVIIDMSPLKVPSAKWASEYLPDEVHVVGMSAVVNPKYLFDGTDETKRATADYFDKGTMMVMPGVKCIQEAIRLASDFATILGSKPHFYDPAEHDALVASTEKLPALLGAAYFHYISRSSGWGDIQRLSNPAFGMLTHHLFDTHPDDLRDLWLDDSANLLRHLDEVIASLGELRAVIAKGDGDGLGTALEDAAREYELWVNRRHNNRWQTDEMLDTKTPTFGGMMSTMIGGSLASKLRGKKDDDK